MFGFMYNYLILFNTNGLNKSFSVQYVSSIESTIFQEVSIEQSKDIIPFLLCPPSLFTRTLL